jgi:hypothetical protein
MTRHPNSPRRQRTAQRREGTVLLIVLLVITMATGTAVYTLSSTTSEQRLAGQISEGAWTVCVAEGAAMSGVADWETKGEQSAVSGIDQRWLGTTPLFTTRYGVSGPILPAVATANPPVRTFDSSADAARFSAVRFPAGTAGFAPPLRSALTPYEAPGASPRLTDFRSITTSWTAPMVGGQSRSRAEVTGFGETRLASDLSDLLPLPGTGAATEAQRGLHTTVAMVRAYVDTVEW